DSGSASGHSACSWAYPSLASVTREEIARRCDPATDRQRLSAFHRPVIDPLLRQSSRRFCGITRQPVGAPDLAGELAIQILSCIDLRLVEGLVWLERKACPFDEPEEARIPLVRVLMKAPG